MDPNLVQAGSDTTIMTTQPPQLREAKLSDVPDGWSECILTYKAKATILQTPGYPQPILRRARPVHCIREGTCGLGVFATEDIQMGELIFSERALFIGPAAARFDVRLPENCTAEQRRQVILHESEKEKKIAIDRMPDEYRKRFMALANSHLHDGSGPIMGIIRTNGFGIGGFGKSCSIHFQNQRRYSLKV